MREQAERSGVRIPGFATGLALIILITLPTMAVVLLAPVLPQLFAEYRGVPHAEYLVPMVLTLPALCIALLSPAAGALGDYFGRRKLLIAALVMYGLIGVAPIFLRDLSSILVARIGLGITEAMIITLGTAMLADYFVDEQRSKWLAAQAAVSSLSALLFFVVGGYLGTFGWRTPFWVYASVFIMLAGVLAFTWEVAPDEGARTARSASWQGFPFVAMGGMMMVTLFGSVLFYVVQLQAASGLAALGLSDSARIGVLTSIASISVPLGAVVYSRFAKLSVSILFGVEFALLGVGFVLMGQATSIPQFLFACAVNQLGAGMLLPTLVMWAIHGLPFEIRARGTGTWASAFTLGQFLSPLLFTITTKATGSLMAAFQCLGYIAMAAALLALGTWWRSTAAAPGKAT